DVATSLHFGDYYAPIIVAAGPKLIAFWRTNEQPFTDRMFAISKNGGRTFGKVKKLRMGLVTQIAAFAGDASGSIYVAGQTADPRKFVIQRSDARLKNFSASATIDAKQNVAQ